MILLEWRARPYVEDYNFDVPEGMELMTYTQHRPDDGNTRGGECGKHGPHVSGITRCELEDSSDMSRMDTAELAESNAGSIVDNSLCVSIRNNFSSVDAASMSDFDIEYFDDAISFDSDKGSVAELEWNTLGRRICVGVSECIWGFSAGFSYSHTGGVIKGRCISHGRLWISGVGCLLDWT